MKCPYCNAPDTQVIDSRPLHDGVRRRRRCLACKKRFTTIEAVIRRLPRVIKSSGERQDFDVEKLRTSFTRALHKRPVPAEQIDFAIENIIEQVISRGEREIASREVGEMAMRALRELDPVAYIRFASVYRAFQDIEDFRNAIKEL
jgi:transcriptional repressor NrdR